MQQSVKKIQVEKKKIHNRKFLYKDALRASFVKKNHLIHALLMNFWLGYLLI